jgi:TetR/AcrR family transcriptional regulator, transcriptional repressor for nem operon
MRYEKGHKDATRKHIVKVASKRFRRDGVEAVGVVGLMADAGLTHGGFYSHFASKEELVQATTVDALEGGRAQLARAAGADGGLEGIVRAYLRPAHRDAPARGCAFAALTSEIARRSPATRAAFTREFEAHIDLIAGCLPAGDACASRRAAIAIFSLMMGALQLARAVADKDLSDRILESGVEAALTLADARVVARDGAC